MTQEEIGKKQDQMEQGSTWFQNRGLFSDHFLQARLPEWEKWKVDYYLIERWTKVFDCHPRVGRWRVTRHSRLWRPLVTWGDADVRITGMIIERLGGLHV